ncbi:MAG: DUF1028 domain-containing protein [Firmicutes bacterium]|nr:DUF1028 domain-containing protein [Bacillota bacterium]
MLKLATFSITARCFRTGMLGVAVSTAVPCVGSLVPHVRAGVGAVATQSWVNPYIGIWGLELLAEGLTAAAVVESLEKRDPQPHLRQFAVVSAKGDAAAYTGSANDTWCGHKVHQDFVVAGNMLAGSQVLDAMEDAYKNASGKELVERLLQALEAGQAAGGDKRGKVSAALYVAASEDYPLWDLRVDVHEDPVAELGRVYRVAREDLLPFVKSLPTRENPKGQFDLSDMREKGLLQD